MKTQNTRLYYIDWLRVLAFCLLFLFHSWRPFDHMGWSIKNAEQSKFFDILTFFIHGWRMDLIFLVSGVGTWFALNSRKSKFYTDRIKRLIIPFIVGIILIIPPQKYYEAVSFHGFQGNFIDFLKVYPSIMFSFNFGPSVLFWFGHLGAHIYYLPYLFLMTILIIPAYKLIKKLELNTEKLNKIIVSPYGVFLLILPVLIVKSVLKPLFPNYTDWADFFSFICMFAYGFIFIKNLEFVEIVKKKMWLFLNIGVISNILLLHFISSSDTNMQVFLKPQFGLTHIYVCLLTVLISFSWVMFFVGLAAKKLNFDHIILQPANTSILPVYILHQTLIILFGYYICHLQISIFIKYFLIVVTAIPTSVMLYMLLQKVNFLRFLFGLKPITNKATDNTTGQEKTSISISSKILVSEN